MSLLDFNESSPKRSGSRKPFKLILGIGALIGTITLGSTLAASINLNDSGPVEFGQGVTQTTACDSDVVVTPTSSFVNADGGGDFKFSSITLSDLDGTDQAESSEGCAGKTFTIKAYDAYGAQLQPIYEISVNSAGIFSSPDGDVDGTEEGNTESSVTLSFDGELISAESVYRITIESEDSVDVTPTSYEVGDRGPGGGIVFYVSATNFTSAGSNCNTECKYLEVALGTWQQVPYVDSGDLDYAWSTDRDFATGQDILTPGTESGFPSEKFNWKIGQGFNNTRLMKVFGARSDAQDAVLVYAGSQWFIPSMNELNELCKYARGQATGSPAVACDSSGTLKTTSNAGNELGGFRDNLSYWSSSEYDADYAWNVNFADGSQFSGNDKNQPIHIRPIRAF